MSAVPKEELRLEAMTDRDLDEVLAIEKTVYSHPWTRGNFADSLRAGYECRTLRLDAELIGYCVLLIGPGEAHLLNLSIAGTRQRRGHGTALLREVLRIAREHGAARLFLEVRPSNVAARKLYESFGFHSVGVRGAYYPAHHGREDALVMTTEL